MPLKLKKLIIFTVLLAHLSSSYAVERKDLLVIIEKISQSQRSLSLEVSKWNNEKETLLTELSLLKSSIKDHADNHNKLKENVDELKKKKKLLQDAVAKQEKLQKTIGSFINKNSSFLVNISSKIPESLQYLISDEVKRLKSQLKSSSVTNNEKLSTINSLTSALIKLQKEVHKTKEVISLSGEEYEVDAIYLGTFTGYFKSPANQSAGLLKLDSKGQWKASESSDNKEEILALFNQFEKKAAPKIIKLPVGGSK